MRALFIEYKERVFFLKEHSVTYEVDVMQDLDEMRQIHGKGELKGAVFLGQGGRERN